MDLIRFSLSLIEHNKIVIDVVWTVKGDTIEVQNFEILKAKDSNFITRELAYIADNVGRNIVEVFLPEVTVTLKWM